MLQKVASTTHTKTLIDFQTYFNLYTNQPSPECLNVIYYQVLSQRCDDKETLLNIINNLYQEFVVTKKKKWILLEGDQATYERLSTITGLDMVDWSAGLEASDDYYLLFTCTYLPTDLYRSIPSPV